MYLTPEFLELVKEKLKENYEYGGDIWKDCVKYSVNTIGQKNRSPSITLDSDIIWHTHPTDSRGIFFPPSTPDILVTLRLILRFKMNLRHFIFSDKKIYYLCFPSLPFLDLDFENINVVLCKLFARIQEVEYKHKDYLKSERSHEEVFKAIHEITGGYILVIDWPPVGKGLRISECRSLKMDWYFPELDISIDMSKKCRSKRL